MTPRSLQRWYVVGFTEILLRSDDPPILSNPPFRPLTDPPFDVISSLLTPLIKYPPAFLTPLLSQDPPSLSTLLSVARPNHNKRTTAVAVDSVWRLLCSNKAAPCAAFARRN